MYFSLIAAFLLLPGIVNLPAMASAQTSSCPGIRVKVLNIKNSRGNVACALFESPVGFPVEYLGYATNIMVIKIRDAQAQFTFLDLSLIHI